jgi:hypothetical protein
MRAALAEDECAPSTDMQTEHRIATESLGLRDIRMIKIHTAREAQDSRFASVEADGAIVVSAATVASGLELSINALLQHLRSGLVYQATERGIGEDEGNLRITFRYRNRQFQTVIDRSGNIVRSSST